MSDGTADMSFRSLITIFRAHKAADPDQFPVRDSTRALYPALYGIEERFKGKSTPVHLQVYDGMCMLILSSGFFLIYVYILETPPTSFLSSSPSPLQQNIVSEPWLSSANM